MIYRKIHFIGAGGVGVSGLAHIALDLGCDITCSDASDSPVFETLRRHVAERLGDADTRCRIGHSPLADGTELVVYSSAVPESDPERSEAFSKDIPQMRRGDFLNHLALEFPFRIAVSGSHGKTTTSAMIAHILKRIGLNPGYMVGGSVNGWSRSASLGGGRILVTEVDESDGSQAGFPATVAIVLNIDDDHSWGLGGPRALDCCFIELGMRSRNLLAWRSEATERLFGGWRKAVLLDTPAEAASLHGMHNRINAAMAVKACEALGVAANDAIAALDDFPGVSRRMSERAKSADGSRILLEDYAHHPTELDATLSALRETYPGKRLLVVFQPHRIERVERYGARFAELLSKTDWCCVVEPFAAWRTDGRTADVKSLIADKVKPPCPVVANSPDAIAALAAPVWLEGTPAVLAVIGAGDVTHAVATLQQRL